MNAPLQQTRRRNTDNQLLAKWGYDEHAPADIVEMAQLSQHLSTIRAGQAVAYLGIADTETIERHLREKPADYPLLEYLAQKIEGLRPEIQRILALQDNMPYYRQLNQPHPSLNEKTIMAACAKLEATLIVTPSNEPCLVFTEHDNARRYSTIGRQEQSTDPIRLHFGRMPILAVGARNVITSRLDISYTQTGEVEQNHITPSSATTDVQKRLIQIFEEAIHRKSSNIAIQPDISGMTNIRIRVNGDMTTLRTGTSIPPDVAVEIFNTLHTWSNATYTDKQNRVQGQLQGPAGGSFTYRSSDSEVFIRASFTPPDSLGGAKLECVSLRLMERNQLQPHLTDLNIKPDVINAIDDAIREQRGIILLVGSTSSGKSTTIHGAIERYQSIHGTTKNILSIENPVERQAPGLVSHSITANFGFDLMMAEILRQDPDCIYIGEMRDRSSASTGIRAANSGHIVLSTLHANDSLQTLGALRAYISNHTVDNGAAVMVSDFDLVTSINLIVAQQLVPKLCPHCRQSTPQDIQEAFGERIIRYLKKHGLLPTDKSLQATFLARVATAIQKSYLRNSEGCQHAECQEGYAGSLPINEYFAPDAQCKQMLIDMLASNRLNFERIKPFRNKSLFDAALERVEDGETPLESLYV